MGPNPNKKSFPKHKKGKPGQPTKKNAPKPKNKKNKLHVKFDMADRKDYLKGFQKRKQERREKARIKMEEGLKNELKQLRKERREMMKKMVYDGYEVKMLSDQEESDEENPDVTVTTCGTATVEIAPLNLMAKLHPEASKISLGEDDSDNNSQEKSKGDEEKKGSNGIPTYTKDKLEELGIFSKKDLQRSWKQSAAKSMKSSKVMQKREVRHAREQRKSQKKFKNTKNSKKKTKLKKFKQNRGKK